MFARTRTGRIAALAGAVGVSIGQFIGRTMDGSGYGQAALCLILLWSGAHWLSIALAAAAASLVVFLAVFSVDYLLRTPRR